MNDFLTHSYAHISFPMLADRECSVVESYGAAMKLPFIGTFANRCVFLCSFSEQARFLFCFFLTHSTTFNLFRTALLDHMNVMCDVFVECILLYVKSYAAVITLRFTCTMTNRFQKQKYANTYCAGLRIRTGKTHIFLFFCAYYVLYYKHTCYVLAFFI